MTEDDKTPKTPDIAVALQYEENSQEAPRVVAKGQGEIARRIVEMAEENGVTVEANGPLAEALSGVEIDDTIPFELYQAAAEVIGFVLKARSRIK